MGSLAVEPTYLSHVSAASFDSTDPVLAISLHIAHGDHSKLFIV